MILLEEFDDNKKAIINPDNLISKIDNMPEVAIACFSHVLFNEIVSSGNCKKIGELNYTNAIKDIYEISYKGKKIALFMMDVGAPAAVANMEDVHAMGVNKFIVFGNCGVLDESIADCAVIIPNCALRDEGTSFHYQKPSKTINMNGKYTSEFKKILNEFNYNYVEGTTWTTDAFYRETKNIVSKRKKEGAIVVEMEASALQAVANFRGIDLFMFFYAGDNLGGDNWDMRSLYGEIKLDEKAKIAYLALELANRIQ